MARKAVAGDKPKKMNDSTLLAILEQKISRAVGRNSASTIVKDREKALDYYHGRPFGNEEEGRSKVVSHDVAEAVDSIMPSLMRIFAAGDTIARFEPTGAEDEEAAKQATDYINWIWTKKNNAFEILYTWFKDALLQKNGVVKIFWDESERITNHTYNGLTEDELTALLMDDELELVEILETRQEPLGSAAGMALTASPTPGQTPDPNGASSQELGAFMAGPTTIQVYDVKVRRTTTDGQIRIVNIPPEEFFIGEDDISLDDPKLCGHRSKKTLSQLIEMGFPRDKVMNLPGDDTDEFNTERQTRRQDEDPLVDLDDEPMDPSMREVWVTEAYVRVDYDGDGVAELRKITFAGNDESAILDNEETDGNPFAATTPNPMPHKWSGLSLADQTMDIQLVKSVLLRQMLDNLYLTNSPRLIVGRGVNLDDLLVTAVGSYIRSDDVAQVSPITTEFTAAASFPMLDYFDQQRAERTGVTKYTQGLDADSLNKTATGIGKIMDAGQQRMELIARLLAEIGVRRAFQRTLELLTKHQQKPAVIRLRGKWVPMDPREWHDKMDLTVTVGLGTGNKDKQLAQLMALLQVDAQIAQFQGGVEGPVLTVDNIYNKLEKIIEAAGLGGVEPYYTDPTSIEMPPEKPSPEEQKAKAEIEAMVAKGQAEIQLEREKMQAEIQMEREKLQAEIAADQQKLQAELQRKAMEMNAKIQLQERELAIKAEQGAFRPQAPQNGSGNNASA